MTLGASTRMVPAMEARLGPNRLRFHSRGEDNHRTYALVEWEMAPPPAPGPPPHRHLDADEGCYVLTGKLTLEIEGSSVAELRPGDFGLIPKGEWHTLSNPGPEPARFLVILSPPGFEGYWAEQADRMARKGGPLDPEEVAELQTKYKMDAGGAVRRFE